MRLLWVVKFILQYIIIVNADNKYENTTENSLTNGLLFLLNGTFFDLKEKMCNLQGDVDVLEAVVNRYESVPRSDHFNNSVLTEFKELVRRQLQAFSKIQNGFENSIRLLQKEQEDIWELVNTTRRHREINATKDKGLGTCTEGWITAARKCYYVSQDVQKTNWESANNYCGTVGGKLVELKNDEEANDVFQMMPDRIRLRDYIYTGEKRTDDGMWVFQAELDPVDIAARTWAPDEPGGSPENCGCVSKEDTFMMTDCHCRGFYLHFICEKPRTTG
ncbi:low affinity immunoglobulin epsilon Fc receptor-like [Ylistrum balloti]|uniref:low affinity immunoglobulin epsilon Fc receptor-like n=1 Tax=Ylistrum balloti TaxID=509963 RepID=UPI0029059F68|nr:low affinity immunoglobulin epsilon Fc receptor-like [Ylistrum balloti]